MLGNIFGPGKEEVWRQLAAEVSGTFVDGGFFGKDAVEVRHGDWLIRLDTRVVSTGKVTIIYTQLLAPFANPDKFRFSITRQNIFTDIGKFFGMQDIAVGYPAFDEAFLIQGTDAEKVCRLFSNTLIRELLAELPKVHFEVKPNEGIFSTPPPAGTELLYFRNMGIIKDLDRLKKLYSLFAETLEELSRLAPAT
jgi:hypothetical protein